MWARGSRRGWGGLASERGQYGLRWPSNLHASCLAPRLPACSTCMSLAPTPAPSQPDTLAAFTSALSPCSPCQPAHAAVAGICYSLQACPHSCSRHVLQPASLPLHSCRRHVLQPASLPPHSCSRHISICHSLPACPRRCSGHMLSNTKSPTITSTCLPACLTCSLHALQSPHLWLSCATACLPHL